MHVNDLHPAVRVREEGHTQYPELGSRLLFYLRKAPRVTLGITAKEVKGNNVP